MKDWPKLALECRYRVGEMTKCCGVTAGQLRSFCKHTVHLTTKKWLRELRLVQAEVYLLTGKSTEEVARSLGYIDAPHFCHEFKRAHGMSPQAWAERNRGSNPQARVSPIRLPALPSPKEFPNESEFHWLGVVSDEHGLSRPARRSP